MTQMNLETDSSLAQTPDENVTQSTPWFLALWSSRESAKQLMDFQHMDTEMLNVTWLKMYCLCTTGTLDTIICKTWTCMSYGRLTDAHLTWLYMVGAILVSRSQNPYLNTHLT
jgi:hypothetical protein